MKFLLNISLFLNASGCTKKFSEIPNVKFQSETLSKNKSCSECPQTHFGFEIFEM